METSDRVPASDQTESARNGEAYSPHADLHSIGDVPEPVRLSNREVEILELIAEGKASKEIADILFLSRRTVDFHVSKTFSKLGTHNRMAAIRRAKESGFLRF